MHKGISYKEFKRIRRRNHRNNYNFGDCNSCINRPVNAFSSDQGNFYVFDYFDVFNLREAGVCYRR